MLMEKAFTLDFSAYRFGSYDVLEACYVKNKNYNITKKSQSGQIFVRL